MAPIMLLGLGQPFSETGVCYAMPFETGCFTERGGGGVEGALASEYKRKCFTLQLQNRA